MRHNERNAEASVLVPLRPVAGLPGPHAARIEGDEPPRSVERRHQVRRPIGAEVAGRHTLGHLYPCPADVWLFDTFSAAVALYVWPRLQLRRPRLAALNPLLVSAIFAVAVLFLLSPHLLDLARSAS